MTGPYYLYGSKATKIFDALGALGSLAFAYNIVIIPEVQVRPSLEIGPVKCDEQAALRWL